jgi:transposase
MVAQAEIALKCNTAPKYIPLERFIELYCKGLSQVEIAKVLGINSSNVCRRLARHEKDLAALPVYKQNRADVLAFWQRRLLNSIEEADIKKASAYQRVGMFGILYDKERLERGETTQNIGYADYTKALSSVLEKRKQLEAELGIDASDSVQVSENDEAQDQS